MGQFDHLCGHIYDQAVQEEVTEQCYSLFGDLPLESGAGKSRKLYTNVRKIMGGDQWQEIQKIGDCTPHATQRGYMTTFGTRLIVLGYQTGVIPIIATEPLYAYSRHEIMRDMWKGRDGTSQSACIKAGQKYGFLKRQRYPNYDFSQYNSSLARTWGNVGVPDDLDVFAESDKILSFYPSFGYVMARDLIYNGFAVMVSSNWGFENARRGRYGEITPSGTWSHSMLYTAMDDDPAHPGLLLDNKSWPNNWVSGPKRDDEPDGTGWVPAEVCDDMLAGRWGHNQAYPDSYGISNTMAFPSQAAELDTVEMF